MNQEKARRRYVAGNPATDGLAANRFAPERTYQVRFVSRLFLLILTLTTASALITITVLWRFLYHPQAPQQTSLVAAVTGAAGTVLFELLLAIPLVYYFGVRQSHRVVGPMRRIQRALGAIGGGDFSQRVSVRQGDALEDLAKSINRMADHLQRRQNRSSGS